MMIILGHENRTDKCKGIAPEVRLCFGSLNLTHNPDAVPATYTCLVLSGVP